MIKFRAWDKENKRWMTKEIEDSEESEIRFDLWGNVTFRLPWWEQVIDGIYTVDGSDMFDIMQSTGLIDVNDVEIFEGDIVKLTEKTINGGIDTHTCKVFQSKSGAWRLEGRPDFSKEYTTKRELYSVRNRVEIIGNVWENPELMEVQE